MPSDPLRRALREMEQDVHGLVLAPASRVRARGETRRRRAAAVAVGLAVLAVLAGAALWSRSPWTSHAAGPPSSTCPPGATPTYGPREARVFMKPDATQSQS